MPGSNLRFGACVPCLKQMKNRRGSGNRNGIAEKEVSREDGMHEGKAWIGPGFGSGGPKVCDLVPYFHGFCSQFAMVGGWNVVARPTAVS